MKIAIDIGHTAHTSACSPYAVEHSMAARMGQELARLLQRESPHEVKLIDHPEMLNNNAEFKQVVAEANAWGADVLISLHGDSSCNEGARGAHVCYRSKLGQRLAQKIAAELCSLMPGRAESTVQRMDLYVLRHTKAVAVLIELGFITNAEDVAQLQEKQEAIARAILSGILDYCN